MFLSRTWSIWRRKPFGVLGALIILFFLVVALFAPMIAPNEPYALVARPLQDPSSTYPLGTNSLGQDVFSRTIYGAQISIAAGLSATLASVILGTMLGVVAGYFGGWTDAIVQRGLEVLASFPGLVLVLIIVAAVGRSEATSTNLLRIAWELRSLEIAIAVSFIFGISRIIRAAVLRERALPYIEAAQSIGASSPRILLRHILPNVLPYVVVIFSTIIGAVILIEASLSFLGYGVSSGTPSWGIDLSASNRQYFLRAPWLLVGPGVALSLTVLGYNFFGDALRDLMDPRLRGSR